MTGFFSPKFAQTMTEWSNYYIDWSRVGELLKQKTQHKYSWHELSQRGAILASTGLGAYAGYTYANSDSNFMTGLYSMSGCFVGFVISHLIVIAPLMYKRYQFDQGCIEKEKMLMSTLQNLNTYSEENLSLNDLITTICEHIKAIKTMSFSSQNRANASLTWGRRHALLTNLNTKLEDDINQLARSDNKPAFLEEMQQFWGQNSALLAEKLKSEWSEERESNKQPIATPI